MKLFNLPLVAVLQLAIATRTVYGAPAPDNGVSGLIISHIVPVGEYNMTYWVDAQTTGTVASRVLSASACGSNDVTCSGSHLANTDICRQLVNSLNTGTSIGNSPRSICLGQSNNQCCVSWSGAVGTMPESNLVNAANRIFGTCWSPTNGSGLARSVILNNICVTECLSNRPDGCS
ncbi:hypothetical protein B0H19DRAFT_1269185 [Mycena capillaripes]|nr:hypothetical protein B0H19DRAFT_1085903 [Mycena capillaripes]KAJ6540624.1 hypothetical protein B0H19DRAFT_1269185 [Mycena capillaripes]